MRNFYRSALSLATANMPASAGLPRVHAFLSRLKLEFAHQVLMRSVFQDARFQARCATYRGTFQHSTRAVFGLLPFGSFRRAHALGLRFFGRALYFLRRSLDWFVLSFRFRALLFTLYRTCVGSLSPVPRLYALHHFSSSAGFRTLQRQLSSSVTRCS